MATQGYGLFTTEPNAQKSLECNICGAECLVERNLPVPLGFIAAMAGLDKPRDKFYDEFSCPNLKEKWHKQAVKLVKEIQKTPSKRIAHLMQQDLEDLLHENNSHQLLETIMFRYFKDLDKLANALRVEHFATMGDELKCIDSQDLAKERLAWMKANDFDIVPVIKDGKKSFFVDREKDLKDIADGEIIVNNHMQPIPFSELVKPDELIKVALELLSERGWFFVGTGDVLEGIVTLEDFGRPAVSFYFLAKLLMVESGLRRLWGTYTNNPTTDSPSKDGVDGDPKSFGNILKEITNHSREAKRTNKPNLLNDLKRSEVTEDDLSSIAALRNELAHGRNILSLSKSKYLDVKDPAERNRKIVEDVSNRIKKIDKVLETISTLDDNRPQIWKAYEDTVIVKRTLKEEFWVGSNVVDLSPYLLSSSNLYIISAENPSGEVLSKERNKDRTDALRNVLNGRRLKNNDGKWECEEVDGQSCDGKWKQAGLFHS